MNYQELLIFLGSSHENENIEFKEAKQNFSFLGGKDKNKKSVLGYAVAIGNEGGGKLILGIEDKTKKIIGTNVEIPQNAKQKIYEHIGKKIQIEEIFSPENKRILVITFPGRQNGELLKFYGIPLTRVGEDLKEMDDLIQRDILLEGNLDFSSEIVLGASVDNLDSSALEYFKILYTRRKPNTLTTLQILNNIGLIEDNRITFAALILLGNETSLRKYLANSEIIFEFRNNFQDIVYADRVNYRKAYILAQQEIWEKIYSRNQITQISEGFITREISAYDEDSIKESINNAVAHRDYRDPASVIIKQSPQEFEVQNPGGFLTGITPENIIDAPSKPRNRLLSEALEFIGFVQRAGQGMDTIFQKSIEQGKGKPDFSESNRFYTVLRLQSQVRNRDFIKFLQRVIHEKQISFSPHDLLTLQEIEIGTKKFNIQDVQKFINLGIVEKIGNTRGVKYIMSHKYYASQYKAGLYTKIVGLKRDEIKTLIMNHLRKNKKGYMKDFLDTFSELERHNIGNILSELKKENKIRSVGSTRNSYWEIIK